MTISDTGSKQTALHQVLGLEFPQLICGMEKGNFIPKKKKNLEKIQISTFKHQKKLVTDKIKTSSTVQSERPNSTSSKFQVH